MLCKDCGTEISAITAQCPLCGNHSKGRKTSMQKDLVILDAVEVTSFQISWLKVFFFVTILIVIALPWLLMHSFFVVPDEVGQSRRDFANLKHQYMAHEKSWDQQKNEILSLLQSHDNNSDITKDPQNFHNLPYEVVLSYILDDLGFRNKSFKDCTLYPVFKRNQVRFILSKPEKDVWPLKVISSLEIAVNSSKEGVEFSFLRLRRGSKEIPINLAWNYFGPELQQLRSLEGFVGGVRDLCFSKEQPDASVADGRSVRASWKYINRPMTSTS